MSLEDAIRDYLTRHCVLSQTNLTAIKEKLIAYRQGVDGAHGLCAYLTPSPVYINRLFAYLCERGFVGSCIIPFDATMAEYHQSAKEGTLHHNPKRRAFLETFIAAIDSIRGGCAALAQGITPMYLIDGNEQKRIDGYGQWKVIDEHGSVYCIFYGPYAYDAACLYCREKNGGEIHTAPAGSRLVNGVPSNYTPEQGGVTVRSLGM